MRIVTTTLDPNEKAYRLSEVNLIRPPVHQFHRYQIILVNRLDQIAEWWYDLGPAENFTANQFTFPLLWEHSVAEAKDMAETKRNDNYWQRFMAEKLAESTLLLDAVEQRDEHRKVIHNQSVFGPGGHTQRNGAPIKEAVKDELSRRHRG